MVSSSTSSECKQYAAEILGHLARRAANKGAIAAAGGIAPLLTLCKSDASLLAIEMAIGALAALAMDSEEMQRLVAQAGAVPVLVPLALVFSSDTVKDRAIAALVQLNKLEENQALIVGAGGGPLVED